MFESKDPLHEREIQKAASFIAGTREERRIILQIGATDAPSDRYVIRLLVRYSRWTCRS